jgi:hypothetical protein
MAKGPVDIERMKGRALERSISLGPIGHRGAGGRAASAASWLCEQRGGVPGPSTGRHRGPTQASGGRHCGAAW